MPDAFGTRVVWKTIRVKWLLLERTPPAIHGFVLGKVGYFAHNTLGKGQVYPCIVSMEGALCLSGKGVGNSLCGHSKMIGHNCL